MTRILTALACVATLVLAGCGADGEPERPTRAETPQVGVSVTGTAQIGIVGSL